MLHGFRAWGPADRALKLRAMFSEWLLGGPLSLSVCDMFASSLSKRAKKASLRKQEDGYSILEKTDRAGFAPAAFDWDRQRVGALPVYGRD